MGTDFNAMYEGAPPWDIGRPQPSLVELEEAGHLQGAVLDVGCGTGENALFLAARAHPVWGVDFSPRAIEKATAKARRRGLGVVFKCIDALDLANLERRFDTVIDSGLFHLFSNEERPRFVEGLQEVLMPGGHYFMLCFSEHETREGGPRRVTRREIEDTFKDGWRIERIVPAIFDAHLHSGGSRAWLSTIRRLEERASH